MAGLSEEPIFPWRETSDLHPFYPHMAPRDAVTAFEERGWNFFAYRRATCVRNPYPRLVSLYRMIADTDPFWRIARRIGIGPPKFTNWLERSRPYGRGGGGRAHQRWRQFGAWSAENWCHDAMGRRLVTDILPLERLEDELPPLLASLGIPRTEPLPVLNARSGIDWPLWYNGKSRALVAQRYAWDIENFQYF